MNDWNGIWTHNDIVHKPRLSHLAIEIKWMRIVLWTKITSDYGLKFHYSHLLSLISRLFIWKKNIVPFLRYLIVNAPSNSLGNLKSRWVQVPYIYNLYTERRSRRGKWIKQWIYCSLLWLGGSQNCTFFV